MTTPSDGPQLIVRGNAVPQAVSLERGQHFSIGRAEDNAIVLDDASVSRRHAVLQLVDGRFHLVDLGSRNGSFVNDRRVAVPVTVRNGDRLRFGQVDCDFTWPGQDHPTTLVAEGPATYMLQVRRLISVLVVDIRGFTTMTRKLDERILAQAVGAWFSDAGQILHRAGGSVDKYIGDAVMALFNAPLPQADHALAAARAALAMQREVQRLSAESDVVVAYGIGINTGSAVVGNIGTEQLMNYTAIGDAVNVASRLQSNAPAGTVLLSASTYDLVAGRVEVEPLDPIQVKGRQQPVAVYRLLDA